MDKENVEIVDVEEKPKKKGKIFGDPYGECCF